MTEHGDCWENLTEEEEREAMDAAMRTFWPHTATPPRDPLKVGDRRVAELLDAHANMPALDASEEEGS